MALVDFPIICETCGRGEMRLIRAGLTCNQPSHGGGHCQGVLMKREELEAKREEEAEQAAQDAIRRAEWVDDTTEDD